MYNSRMLALVCSLPGRRPGQNSCGKFLKTRLTSSVMAAENEYTTDQTVAVGT